VHVSNLGRRKAQNECLQELDELDAYGGVVRRGSHLERELLESQHLREQRLALLGRSFDAAHTHTGTHMSPFNSSSNEQCAKHKGRVHSTEKVREDARQTLQRTAPHHRALILHQRRHGLCNVRHCVALRSVFPFFLFFILLKIFMD
jgi:hypothetical protein